MNENDYESFGKLIYGVFGVYTQNANDEIIEIYYRSLREFSIKEISNAFTKHLKNPNSGTFLPKPADIIKIIEGDSKNKSMIAWDKVNNAMNHVTTSYDVVFDDPIIHAAIRDMGGWLRFRNSINEFSREKIEIGFRDRYKNYIEFGLIDYPNILKGDDSFVRKEPPVFFGNKSKALDVLNGEFKLLK